MTLCENDEITDHWERLSQYINMELHLQFLQCSEAAHSWMFLLIPAPRYNSHRAQALELSQSCRPWRRPCPRCRRSGWAASPSGRPHSWGEPPAKIMRMSCAFQLISDLEHRLGPNHTSYLSPVSPARHVETNLSCGEISDFSIFITNRNLHMTNFSPYVWQVIQVTNMKY